MQTTIKQGQTFLDAVLEATGNINNAFEMARANGVTITDVCTIGQQLAVAGTVSNNMVSLLTGRFAPATALTTEQQTAPTGGIGSMQIGSTFIVS